ncbi:MAG: YraN family protein [Calditrichaeota bacterium]|nr:MAG: YraN family protein [Calditrichota bacterium]
MSQYRKKFGAWGEEIAAQYLEERGLSIIERNYRGERGEIDLIAQDGHCIVFVEVKTGSTTTHGPPEEWITTRKQRQLYKVANRYIQDHPELVNDFRFDVVIIDGTPKNYRVRYYPNAFYIL